MAFAGSEVVRGVRDHAAARLHHFVGGELGAGASEADSNSRASVALETRRLAAAAASSAASALGSFWETVVMAGD